MMPLFLYIQLLHFLGDFVLQSDWMAQNKSTSNIPLLCHVGTYGAVMFAGLSLIPFIHSQPLGTASLWIALYALANAAMHFGVDFITSRINSKLWKEKKVHWFFVSVGFDQFLHYVALFYTLGILL